MINYKTLLDDDLTDWDESDDILNLPDALGPAEVDRRLLTAPWLVEIFRKYWPGGSDSPYITGYVAVARILLTAPVIESRNPEDLAFALDLPPIFVTIVLLGVKQVDPDDVFFASLTKAIRDGLTPERIHGRVDEFLCAKLSGVELKFIPLLKVTGLCL